MPFIAIGNTSLAPFQPQKMVAFSTMLYTNAASIEGDHSHCWRPKPLELAKKIGLSFFFRMILVTNEL